MRTYLCIIWVLSFSLMGIAQQMKSKDWIEDLSYLQEELPKHHVNLFHKVSQSDFDNAINDLKTKVPKMHPEAILWNITSILASVQDSHTQLQFSVRKFFPVGFQFFHDGYYITAINRENEHLMASKLLKVNGRDIGQMEAAILKVFFARNEASKHKIVADVLRNASLLSFMGIVKNNTVLLEVETLNHQKKTVRLSFDPSKRGRGQMAFAMPQEIPFYRQNGRSWFWDASLKDNSILYVKYNACNSREILVASGELKNVPTRQLERIPSFQEFTTNLLHALKNTSYTKLIFDIRGNTGGSSAQGSAFLRAVKETPFFKSGGKVVTLIDGDVFSSAVINTLNSKQMLDATLIGEATSGAPDHFGEVEVLQLPKSGLKVLYSTKFFKSEGSSKNTIVPDIPVKVTINDFVSGKDPVLERAISL